MIDDIYIFVVYSHERKDFNQCFSGILMNFHSMIVIIFNFKKHCLITLLLTKYRLSLF
jgi:hypothetical protein